MTFFPTAKKNTEVDKQIRKQQKLTSNHSSLDTSFMNDFFDKQITLGFQEKRYLSVFFSKKCLSAKCNVQT